MMDNKREASERVAHLLSSYLIGCFILVMGIVLGGCSDDALVNKREELPVLNAADEALSTELIGEAAVSAVDEERNGAVGDGTGTALDHGAGGAAADDPAAVGDAIEQEGAVLARKGAPEGFVYLDEQIPHLRLDMRYYSTDNFVGAQVEGYSAGLALASVEAAEALSEAAAVLADQGFGLVIYDAYRPQRAVEHFIRWSQDREDQTMKEVYYPHIDKSLLFKQGYLASRSGHSRGSTIDLSIYELATGELVDMGSGFDILDEISHFGTKQITEGQARNRRILKDAMVEQGFKHYSKEWWHYVLRDEPYPDTYFTFDVE